MHTDKEYDDPTGNIATLFVDIPDMTIYELYVRVFGNQKWEALEKNKTASYRDK